MPGTPGTTEIIPTGLPQGTAYIPVTLPSGPTTSFEVSVGSFTTVVHPPQSATVVTETPTLPESPTLEPPTTEPLTTTEPSTTTTEEPTTTEPPTTTTDTPTETTTTAPPESPDSSAGRVTAYAGVLGFGALIAAFL